MCRMCYMKFISLSGCMMMCSLYQRVIFFIVCSTLIEQLRELICNLHKISHWTLSINKHVTDELKSLYSDLILGNTAAELEQVKSANTS